MNAEEEKNRLFEIISGHMRINGSEYCSTSEFESDIEDAAEEIYNELATLRAQLAEAKKEPQLRCNHCDRILTATWKTDSGGRFAWVDKCKFCEVITA